MADFVKDELKNNPNHDFKSLGKVVIKKSKGSKISEDIQKNITSKYFNEWKKEINQAVVDDSRKERLNGYVNGLDFNEILKEYGEIINRSLNAYNAKKIEFQINTSLDELDNSFERLYKPVIQTFLSLLRDVEINKNQTIVQCLNSINISNQILFPTEYRTICNSLRHKSYEKDFERKVVKFVSNNNVVELSFDELYSLKITISNLFQSFFMALIFSSNLKSPIEEMIKNPETIELLKPSVLDYAKSD